MYSNLILSSKHLLFIGVIHQYFYALFTKHSSPLYWFIKQSHNSSNNMNLVILYFLTHSPFLSARKKRRMQHTQHEIVGCPRIVKYAISTWVLSIPTFLYAIQSNTLSISAACSTSCDTGWELAKPSSSITSCRTSVRNLCFSCNTVDGNIIGDSWLWQNEQNMYYFIDGAPQSMWWDLTLKRT